MISINPHMEPNLLQKFHGQTLRLQPSAKELKNSPKLANYPDKTIFFYK
jgi:hypothetical protein